MAGRGQGFLIPKSSWVASALVFKIIFQPLTKHLTRVSSLTDFRSIF